MAGAVRHGAWLLALATLPVAACDDLRGTPLHPAVDWQRDIKPIFNELISASGRCTSCHGPGSFTGLDLSDVQLDAIYKIVGSYVVPGRPKDSLLFLKINCDAPPVGARMPPGAPLTRLQQELIHDWIAQGAYGEPDDPIPRQFIGRDGFESLR